MINWINIEVRAAEAALNNLKDSLEDTDILCNDLIEIIREGASHVLCVSSMDVDEIINVMTDLSKEMPEQIFGIRYLASMPGSYHEIVGSVIAGELTIESDTCEKILEYPACTFIPSIRWNLCNYGSSCPQGYMIFEDAVEPEDWNEDLYGQFAGGYGDFTEEFIEMLDDRRSYISDCTRLYLDFEATSLDDPAFCKMLKEVRNHFRKLTVLSLK